MYEWLPAIVIFIYLGIVLYIGVFAFRRGKETGEDFFLASRSVGSIVFFLSLFATNMTAFAILGSSGAAYKQGIGIFGMMATSSALVIPLTLFFIGTRLWAVGKRFGHMTQVAFFRDRFECSFIGTIIFLLTAAMLIPYLIISIDGGGTILSALTNQRISYPLGGAIVALIVMATVFFGGMRGAVWVNVLQTLLFISFGVVAFLYVGGHLPKGFGGAVQSMLESPTNKAPSPMAQAKTLLDRERIPWQVFLSFIFIPLSSIMFPHMSIMCFTARKVTAFKKTVVLYPLCIMAIWLPCVFLGALGTSQKQVKDNVSANSEPLKEWLESGGGKNEHGVPTAPELTAALEKSKDPAAKLILADVAAHKLTALDAVHRLDALKDPSVKPAWNKVASNNSDSVLLEMLKAFVPAGLAGILAAGIISAVMGSDCHQILGLSTMFTKDVVDYYAGKHLGEHTTVLTGRVFILIANGIAYVIALYRPPIFDLAVTYAFSGFAALSPMMIAALFWKRGTKWGALANTLWVAAWVLFLIYTEAYHHYGPNQQILGPILGMSAIGKVSFLGFSAVVPMTLGAALLMVVVSLITPAPSAATVLKYFPSRTTAESDLAHGLAPSPSGGGLG
jgi:Na+/proline symporter